MSLIFKQNGHPALLCHLSSLAQKPLLSLFLLFPSSQCPSLCPLCCSVAVSPADELSAGAQTETVPASPITQKTPDQ